MQAAEAKTQVQETSAPAVENRPAQTERGDFQNRSQNGYQEETTRGERPQGGYQNRDGRTGGYQEETTVVRDHRAAIRTVMEEPAATREETTAVRDHRAAIRTVMEELAVIREETTVR